MKQKFLFIMFALFAPYTVGYSQVVSTVQQAELKDEPVVEEPEKEAEIFQVVEKQPEFPGGMAELMRYLRKNIRYPAICQKQGIQGRVVVQFVVDTDGSVVEPKVVKSVNPHLDAEAVRVISSMPKWTPGMQKGVNVRVRFTMPVGFNLTKNVESETCVNNVKAKACVINVDNDEVEVEVDKMAQFPGGQKELEKYIKKRLKYPKEANGAHGCVEVTFLVNADGRISNVMVTKPVDALLDRKSVV